MLDKKRFFIVFIIGSLSSFAFPKVSEKAEKKDKKKSVVVEKILPYDYKVENNKIKIEEKGSSKIHYLKNLKQYPSIRVTLPYHKILKKDPGEKPDEKEDKKQKREKKLPKKRNLSENDEDKINLLIEKAKSSYLSGDFEEAIGYLKQAKKIDEDSPLVHKMIGSVYMQMGEQGKGLEFYKSSLDLDPDQSDLQIEIERMKEK